jgi:uncharacterized RDD family membrane protein YckC
MAFRRCPDCGAEWWDEERCTDCGAELVDIPAKDEDRLDDRIRRRAALPDTDAEPPRLSRFLGFVVDYFILTVLAVILSLTAGHAETHVVHGRRIREQVSPTAALVVYAVFVLAYATVSVATWGRTPGMLATGVAVETVDADGAGSPPSWGRAGLRALIAMGWFALPAVVPDSSLTGPAATALSWVWFLWPIVVFAPILIDTRRRGLHDLASGTVVVRRPTRALSRQIPWLSSMGRSRD